MEENNILYLFNIQFQCFIITTTINDFKETEEEKEIYTHNHFCIDELTSFITTELRELLILWSYNDLSCRKIKEHLRENGIDLKNIEDKLEELNIIVRNLLRTRPKFEYTFQKIVQ